MFLMVLLFVSPLTRIRQQDDEKMVGDWVWLKDDEVLARDLPDDKVALVW